ncbi:MAG: nucleoside-diphosphate sugar epimerase, partial [Planctomycetes bacterium]|nr:nucleoside-diphosphate sugar epimerase [Planctomycetota bacterium]
MKVLITGASGIVGRHIVAVLEKEHELRLGSRRPPRDDPRWVP